MQNEILDQNINELENDIEVQNIISVNKFVLLSIFSLGLYQIWWIYKAWRFYKQKEKLDIMPAGRAIFSIFFLNSLFKKNLEYAQEKGYDESYSSGSLFAGFLILNFASRLPSPFGLVSLFSFIFCIAPFKALNYAKLNSTEFTVIEQESFNARQIGLIITSLLFWGLVLYGLSLEGQL